MLSRFAKSTFYLTASPLMAINGRFYRMFRAPKSGNHKAHLGPGQNNYLDGWINVDANAFTGRCDVWTDINRQLPFHDNSLDAVYSHHVIEHLSDLDRHCAEVYRCLKPGGIYRVGGPSGDNGIRKFLENDVNWFSDFPVKRQSAGGRLNNFLLCKNEHLTILTESYLSELLENAGFRNIVSYMPTRETGHPDIFGSCLTKEFEDDFDVPHTIILEAMK